MTPTIVHGDLLDQPVEVIVNPWNRNIIPWWLLLPQGVSGAIKKRGGIAPFKQLSRLGAIPLGQALMTEAGSLPFRAIIHVAGINMFWFATRQSIHDSVISAMTLAQKHAFRSIAFPLIGAGSGQRSTETSMQIMLDAFATLEIPLQVTLVKYAPSR